MFAVLIAASLPLSLYWYLFAGLVSVVFFLWSQRRREIFRIEVRDGRVRVRRGHVPPGMLGEFAEVVRRPPVRLAVIVAWRGLLGANLTTTGELDAGREQRLRNIFSLYPASQLRTAPEPDSRSVAEMLRLMLGWLQKRRRR